MFNKKLKQEINELRHELGIMQQKLIEEKQVRSGTAIRTYSGALISYGYLSGPFYPDNTIIHLRSDNSYLNKDDVSNLIKLLQKIHKELK